MSDQTTVDMVNDAINQLGEEFPELEGELDSIESIECDDSHGLISLTGDNTLIVNPQFIEQQTTEQLVGAMAQFALRYQMNVFERIPDGMYNRRAWNIAQDLAINYKLIHELGFSLVENAVVPDEDGSFSDEIGVEVDNVDEKSLEELYEELDPQIVPESEPLELDDEVSK